MRETTLCYIEKDGCYLMLHRTKKKNDGSFEKWLGVGGKIEPGETHEECILRETKEETGLTLTEYAYRGKVNFFSDQWEDEIMYLYTATEYTGELIECNEGTLEWIPLPEVMNLKLWEGDKIFLKLLIENAPFFEMEVHYEGDTLVDSKIIEKE